MTRIWLGKRYNSTDVFTIDDDVLIMNRLETNGRGSFKIQ